VSTRSGVLAHQAHTPRSLVHGHRLCAVNLGRDRRCPSRIIGSDWLCVWMPLRRVIRHEQRCRLSGSSDRDSAVPLQRVTGVRLWSTSPHLCGSRTGISDATSAGHRIGSAMPLRRVIGSKFGGATSAGHRNMVVVNESTLVWISGCDRRCHFSGSSDRTIGAHERVTGSCRASDITGHQRTSKIQQMTSKYPRARGFEWW
jgi:hypothetical protein